MKPLLILPLMLINIVVNAQIIDPKETTRRKATQRTNSGIDRTIDRGLDKVEEGIGSIFKKKDKSEKKKSETPESSGPSSPSTAPVSNIETSKETQSASAPSTSTNRKSLTAYSKFDFVPGEKTIAVEDFSQDQVGDFPANWNTNSTGEVVQLDGLEGKWLKLGKAGIYFPEFAMDLPENATIEFDLVASDDYSEMQSGLRIHLVEMKDRNLLFNSSSYKTQVSTDVHPHATSGNAFLSVLVYDGSNTKVLENESQYKNWIPSVSNRISIWKQKGRFRMYINEAKVWDLQRVFDETRKYAPLFSTNTFRGHLYMSNLRIAVGTADTRHKLLTEGKLVTRGITFDVASAQIKPESQGTFKEIADVLSANPTVKVRIIGHTDADGDDHLNLELSKRRATSVKNALESQYGISSDRLETDGKGETEPVDVNTTATGKANNRRVEFIKL